LINIGLGVVVGAALWALRVRFAVALGAFAALTNFIPYVGQFIGGALPTLIALGHSGSIGDALIVAAVYLAVVGIEGYVVTPLVLGRSLDLNGTTVLIACLFWGFLWGLVGLILAMPITVTMKIVFQNVPELNRWAELMSGHREGAGMGVRAAEAEAEPEPAVSGRGAAPAPAERPRA
jgi:predicted PurR-regulated permease PerM